MIIAILSAEQTLAARLTSESAKACFPEARIVFLRMDQLPELNTVLRDCPDSLCITLRAGLQLLPDFPAQLERGIEMLSGGQASYIRMVKKAEKDTDRRPGPYLWSRELILQSGGIAGRDGLPFGRFAELELGNRIAFAAGSAGALLEMPQAEGWVDRSPRMPKWQNSRIEQRHIIPLLGMQEIGPLRKEPRFSILMAVYNEAPYISWALRSVFNQTFTDWELLIVDDGSGDGTVEAVLASLAGWAVSLDHCGGRIRILRGGDNRGKSACLNQALEQAGGELILELDGDDWLDPDALWQLDHIVKDAAEDEVFWHGDYAEWRELSDGQLIYAGERRFHAQQTAWQIVSGGYPAAPRCYRSNILQQLGGWPEVGPYDGRLYEDMHQLLRVSAAGRLVHVPGILYHRRIRGGSITRRFAAEYRKWKAWAAAEYKQ